MTEEQKNDQGAPQPSNDWCAAQPPETPGPPSPQDVDPVSPQPSPTFHQDAVGQPIPPQQPMGQQAAAPQQPPMGGQMPPRQPYQQPMYGAPQPQAAYLPAPLMQLTGGMKFAWLVVGALLGIPGIIIAWLVNVDKMPQVKSDALKFAIIGFVIWIVLGIVMGLVVGGLITTAVAGALGSYGGSYGHGFYY